MKLRAVGAARRGSSGARWRRPTPGAAWRGPGRWRGAQLVEPAAEGAFALGVGPGDRRSARAAAAAGEGVGHRGKRPAQGRGVAAHGRRLVTPGQRGTTGRHKAAALSWIIAILIIPLRRKRLGSPQGGVDASIRCPPRAGPPRSAPGALATQLSSVRVLRSSLSRRRPRPPSALAPLAVAAALCAFAAGAQRADAPARARDAAARAAQGAAGPDVAPPAVTLTADDVVSHIGGVTQASGKVEVKRLDIDLHADLLTYDQLSDTAHAQGNVRIDRGLDWFSADRVDLELTRDGRHADRHRIRARRPQGRRPRAAHRADRPQPLDGLRRPTTRAAPATARTSPTGSSPATRSTSTPPPTKARPRTPCCASWACRSWPRRRSRSRSRPSASRAGCRPPAT